MTSNFKWLQLEHNNVPSIVFMSILVQFFLFSYDMKALALPRDENKDDEEEEVFSSRFFLSFLSLSFSPLPFLPFPWMVISAGKVFPSSSSSFSSYSVRLFKSAFASSSSSLSHCMFVYMNDTLKKILPLQLLSIPHRENELKREGITTNTALKLGTQTWTLLICSKKISVLPLKKIYAWYMPGMWNFFCLFLAKQPVFLRTCL